MVWVTLMLWRRRSMVGVTTVVRVITMVCWRGAAVSVVRWSTVSAVG